MVQRFVRVKWHTFNAQGISDEALKEVKDTGDEYKRAVRATFLWCAENYEHWVRVPCVDDEGGRYTKPELSEVLYARLAGEFVNKKEGSKA